MKISGFTMVKNAGKYHFPIRESILSILPIVDEFVVALGDCDELDNTREQIESIQSSKVRIIDRVWDEKDFVDGKIFANETSFALSQCSGDWCFYLQADEVIHEQDLPIIQNACESYLEKPEVDGLLFKYNHFYADEKHYLPFRGWYKNEIRIIRNKVGIYSYKDAQSFRKGSSEKLNVKAIDAYIYHYGWVRPPETMQSKKKEQHSMHHGKEQAKKDYQLNPNDFDYGPLGSIPVFKGTHPKVMNEFIEKIHWRHKLNPAKKGKVDRPLMKHEKMKYKILSYLENTFNKGKDIGGYSNWVLMK